MPEGARVIHIDDVEPLPVLDGELRARRASAPRADRSPDGARAAGQRRVQAAVPFEKCEQRTP
jgi:hypothetical protein